ncbi:uncharacterized protein PAC_06261 [Phialocephala subalpina]|uniref:DUF6546 domain-containing protein n=1 Tax=Phialocephala subalpina TaxID=576137 RepID=A0A1L7WUG7_9HELO|nr:uncharacterized protein PAC_06261 [Phialocephala subalpina]
MSSWDRLPAEIRSMILEAVAEDYRFDSEQPYGRAGYARVCREWQPVFEQRNFQRLVLDQDRIDDLEQFMTKQRRELLEHVSLRIRLPEYDCTVCQSEEDEETIRNTNVDLDSNDDVFSTAVWKLLAILSKWIVPEFESRRQQKGLTLELGVYSPSDSQHTTRDFHLEPEYPYQEAKDLDSHFEAYKQRANRLGLDSLNDPYHSWVDGHQDPDSISLESKQRIMGTLTINPTLSKAGNKKKFPNVEIVTGLLIRREFYRKIAVGSLRKLLRESLTCLRWFRHEGWLDVDPQQQLGFEKAYKNLLLKNLPPTLRSLSLFSSSNKLLHPERFTGWRANRFLGKALSKPSRSLETLSAAFLIEAQDFFADFWPPLTSHLLYPEIGRGKIRKLLMAAGRAAAFMPKLQAMEIWNGGEGHAALFRYERHPNHKTNPNPQITWASTWGNNIQLPLDVILCWSNLPQHGSRGCGTKVERIKRSRKNVKTFSIAIRYLKLRRSVLDLVSDYQVFWEEYQLCSKD